MSTEKSFDVLIVGAGFSGLHLLHKLRKISFKTAIYERGGGIGGTWYWNRYPGARVDCDYTFYQFSQDDIWQDFHWTERFPSQAELERYFQHVDNKLHLSNDIQFNTTVTSAQFNHTRNQWLVKTNFDGVLTWANYLILCTGISDISFTPYFHGMRKFKGISCHTRSWPENLSVTDKRVAVIGTGSSGVQIIEEIASKVKHLTVYQRTPNIAVPMRQSTIDDQTNWKFPPKNEIQGILNHSRTTYSGFNVEFIRCNCTSTTPDEREEKFEELYNRGGFHFIYGNYQDIFSNKAANDAIYEFWCKKTRERINDPIKKDILAPMIPLNPFGAKRNALERGYYEVFNQSNVDIIDVNVSPIDKITEKGIKTIKEGETKVDIIIFATGFDAITGGILKINISTDENKSLQKKWKKGVMTHLGISTAGFPNMFFINGPQSPTGIYNGPSVAEIQGDWIYRLFLYMRSRDQKKIEATTAAEKYWKIRIDKDWNMSLNCGTRTWIQGCNIPGKPIESLIFFSGIPRYISLMETSAENSYYGFEIS